MNSVNLVGRLTRDPEMKWVNERALCKMGIAHNEKFKEEERVSFFDVEVWGSQAESCAKYLSKGRQVAITGRLQQDRWETDSGEARSKVKIVALRVTFLGSREEGDVEADDGQQAIAPQTAALAGAPVNAPQVSSDDVTF